MPQNLQLEIDDKEFAHWLYCKTPITEKLKSFSDKVEIKLLDQNWYEANKREKTLFNKNLNKVLRREVTINANSRPCWYAKACIPEETFTNNYKIFSKLENSPLLVAAKYSGNWSQQSTSLGFLIFNEPAIKRIKLNPIQFFTKNDCLIGRITTYEVSSAEYNFYMLELFMPYFKDVINAK